MSRNISIVLLSCLCVFAAVGYAAEWIRVENDMQGAFDRNRDGFLAEEEIAAFHECMKIREQVEHLRQAAQNAQGRADLMRHTAEQTQAEARRLNAEAERLEVEFRRRMEAQPPRPEGERRDGDVRQAELKERIVHLRELSEKAEREGRLEESGRLWKESEELERMLDRDRPDRPDPMDGMRAELKELIVAAERAEREGRPDAARELRQRADNVEREMHAAARGAKMEAMEQEIRELRKAAERHKAEGRHDKAEAILREAENLRRQLQAEVQEGPRPERPDEVKADRRQEEADDDADDEEDDELIDRVQAEVKRLRTEVNELKEVVARIREKLGSR